MSGSSLDGLDIAYCEFQFENKELKSWKLLAHHCQSFTREWQERLRELPKQNGYQLMLAHTALGKYMGEAVNDFIAKNPIVKPDFIASHGHTIFHEPSLGMTCQIGDGAALAATTGITAITDFRSMDIAFGGQGAPLAPVADAYLFSEYDFLVNLGGIANVSARLADDEIIAFDICGANAMLNHIAREIGLEYDPEGQNAAAGKLIKPLFEALNQNDYFKKPFPKSLSNQWVQKQIHEDIAPYTDCSHQDRLFTCVEHIAFQFAASLQEIFELKKLSKTQKYKMLVTGGGAFNNHLIQKMAARFKEKGLNIEIVLPDPEIINYKEAILMALLGSLRMLGIPNSFASCTGASRDTVNGGVYFAGG